MNMEAELKTEIFAYRIFLELWSSFEDIKTMPTILEIYGDECRENIVFEEIYETVGAKNIVNYGYRLWAMYFNKFTEEFYERGGWDDLKRVAHCYEYLYPFCAQFNDENFNLRKVRQAIVNFCHFIVAVRNHERKHKQSIHISKQWIKFRIEHFDSYVNVPLSYDCSLDTRQVEFLLVDLSLVLHPSGCTSKDAEQFIQRRREYFLYLGMSYSEIHPASEEMEIYTDTGIKTLNFEHENRTIDKVPDKFSNIDSDFENQAGKKCPVSEQEILTLDITNTNGNLKCDKNNLTDMELPKQPRIVDLPKNLHIEHNFLPAVNRNKQSETSIKNSSSAVVSDHSCRSNSFVDKDSKMKDFCEGNIVEQDSNAIIVEVISINKMLERTSSENVGTLKDFSNGSTNVNSDDVTEMTRKAREDLRKEQRDPEMKNFLKMLLVLDDEEGTKFVLSMLQNHEEGPENLQESSNKQKKRHKKKKSRKCFS